MRKTIKTIKKYIYATAGICNRFSNLGEFENQIEKIHRKKMLGKRNIELLSQKIGIAVFAYVNVNYVLNTVTIGCAPMICSLFPY